MAFRDSFLQCVHSANTLAADILAAETDKLFVRGAENTGRLILTQNDLVIFHIDLQFIPLRNIQCTAQFNRKHDPAQIVHLTDDSSCLHSRQLLLSCDKLWSIYNELFIISLYQSNRIVSNTFSHNLSLLSNLSSAISGL